MTIAIITIITLVSFIAYVMDMDMDNKHDINKLKLQIPSQYMCRVYMSTSDTKAIDRSSMEY